MIALSTMLMFSAAVVLLLLSPGPNMAFVMAHGAAYGVRGGVAAALGIGAADLVLTALTASGIAGVVAAWPPAFDLIRYAGCLYLLFMAWKAIAPRAATSAPVPLQDAMGSVFFRAMLNSLLNPKALLFFLVFLPQFVDPAIHSVAQQLVIMGCLLTVISTAFHALLGGLASSARRLLRDKPRVVRFQPYALAAMLALLALRLLLMQRPG
jgi:threonine/homoserine/homoserine lactone efflux protein